MSKRLTKLTITVLSVMMALCMVIGLTTIKAYAAIPTVDTFIMVDGASVRTQDPMGIRFTATISSEDYQKLSGGEFGVMITPADFLDNLEEGQSKDLYFRHGAMAEYDADSETQADKFYNYATVIPSVNAKNANEYVMTCSFVGIKEYNFSRPFAARAYCKLGGEYVYTNIVEHAVYSVAADAVANNLIEDENAQTYFDGIIDKVHTKYNTLSVEYSSNVSENAIEAGENFTVSATVSAEDGKSLPTSVVFSDANAFKINEDGSFKANKYGKWEISGVGYLQPSEISIIPGDDTGIRNIAITDIKADGTARFVATIVKDGKVEENPDVKYYLNSNNLTLNIDGTASGVPTTGYARIKVNYTNEYGEISETDNVPLATLRYGQQTGFAHDGIIAEMNYLNPGYLNSTLVYKGVDFDNKQETQLIRLQMVPQETSIVDTPYADDKTTFTADEEGLAAAQGFTDKGMASIQITIQDAEDLNNYVTVAIVKSKLAYYDWRYDNGGLTTAYLGVNAGCWGDYQQYFYGTSTDGVYDGECKIKAYRNQVALRHAMQVKFSFFGNYLTKENYTDYMMGVSVEDTVVYAHINGQVLKIWDLVEDTTTYLSNVSNDSYPKANWTGFKSNKVNIYVRTEAVVGRYDDGTYKSYVMIDTIGGKSVSADDVSRFAYMNSPEGGVASNGGIKGSPVYSVAGGSY